MCQHTPGPWHVSTTHIGEIAVADSRGINLCVLGDASLFDAITPDAAIIAAAPAMYQAGQLSLDVMKRAATALERMGNEGLRSIVRSAIIEQEAALAQAEGKG